MVSPDPQREAARVKREQRRERDREHHRESRGSTGRSGTNNTRRSDRDSSVPHEQEYAIRYRDCCKKSGLEKLAN